MADINAAIQISGYRETAPETISDTIVRIPAPPRSVTPLSEGTSALQAAAVTIKPGDGKGTGRGFFISKDGYLLTNQHVLGRQDAAPNLQRLDDFLQPDIKASAAELAKSISAALKPIPRPIQLETTETETAGPSP